MPPTPPFRSDDYPMAPVTGASAQSWAQNLFDLPGWDFMALHGGVYHPVGFHNSPLASDVQRYR
jgi:hypothetical protein